MRITVKTRKFSGDHNDAPKDLEGHLVRSVYVVEEPHLKVVVNYDGELQCTSSTADTIGFIFSEDDAWQGWVETEVTIFGETPEEIERIKGNPFRQNGKGQLVEVILPWTDVNIDGVFLAEWDAE
jgi:hypothetical protein